MSCATRRVRDASSHNGMASSKIEIGWEGLTALLSAIAVGAASLWGAVQANKADIASMRSTIEMIREDTMYLRERFDNRENPNE